MSGTLISDFDTLASAIGANSKVLCLYSGGLDGSYLLHRLSRMGCRAVTALTVDLGGGDLDRGRVEALCDHYDVACLIEDRRQEFAEDFIAPAISAQATYLDAHPISASLSRPLISKVAVEVAGDRGCDIILHTSNHSQNSLRRFNGALRQLGFHGSFGSPLARTPMPREAKRAELDGAVADTFERRAYSTDTNLWGREFEYGTLDDPEHLEIPEFLYAWTLPCENRRPGSLTLAFEKGLPVAMDGVRVELVQLVPELNRLAGGFCLGRYVGLEEIEGGAKVQEVREMPAAYVLLDAYRRLESACLSAACIREKMHIEQLWVSEAVEGRWYGPLRPAAQEFIGSLARHVTGSVSYQLDLRSLQVTSLRAASPLYVRDRDEYERRAGRPTRSPLRA